MKKIAKIIGVILSLVIILSCTVIPSSAAGESYLSYTTYSTYAKLNKCLEGAKGVINIPDEYNGLPVKVISTRAFENCTQITEVTIPASVTTVESNAFSSCIALKKVTFEGSNCKIGTAAFSYCSDLNNLTLPASLTEIPDDAFAACTSLSSIDIPPTVETIGREAFRMCAALDYVLIPASVKTIKINAFLGCSGISAFGVANGNSVYYASNGCLYGPLESPYDTDVYNPVNEKTLIQYPNAKNGTSYTVESGTLHIADYAFGDNKKLTEIVLPAGLKTIEAYAFYNCTALTSITIPSTVTFIGAHAFGKTAALNSITIPGSVAKLENVFTGSAVKTVVLSNGVKTIGTRCFENCESLTSVTIPDSVTEIGAGAFNGCTALKSLKIPASVTKIGNVAFGECTNLILTVSSGSAAQTYAANNSVKFIIDGATTPGNSDETVKITGIDIYNLPDKLDYYYKEDINTSGLSIIVYKSNGQPEIVNSGFTVNPRNLKETGSVEITVTYGGFEAYYDVDVSYAWWQWLIRILLLGILWY